MPTINARLSRWHTTLGSSRCSRPPACIPARLRRCGWSGCSASPVLSWGRFPRSSGSHGTEAHSLVNADGSFLSAYHLREHPAARDRVCAGNAWIENGRSARESAFAAGRSPMKRRMVPMLMPAGGRAATNASREKFSLRRVLTGGNISRCRGQPLQPVALCAEAVRAQCRAECLSPLFAGAALDRSSVSSSGEVCFTRRRCCTALFHIQRRRERGQRSRRR